MLMRYISTISRTRFAAVRHFRRPPRYNQRAGEGLPKRSFENKKPEGLWQRVSEFFSSGKQNPSEEKPKEFPIELDPKIRYGSTLLKDMKAKMGSSWSTAGLDSFKQIKFKGNLMTLVAADWLKSERFLHDISSSPGGIVQSSLAQGLPEFFLVFNIQAPYSGNLHLVLYYVMKTPVSSLLQRFINGNDQFRNSSLVLYSHIDNFLVQRLFQDVGGPFLVAKEVAVKYVHGKNYLEIEINGSSIKGAEPWAFTAFTALNKVGFYAAFVIQDNMKDEQPLIGTVRLNRLNTDKAVDVDALG